LALDERMRHKSRVQHSESTAHEVRTRHRWFTRNEEGTANARREVAMNNANQGNGNSIQDRVKVIVDQGHEKVDQIKSRVVDVKDQAVNRGNLMLDRATEYIRANPLKAVGIAFGAGYIGMRLFRR
jgi:ElaB/YqjD/DUF883 family membrane-anchored ribosome-binding protein